MLLTSRWACSYFCHHGYSGSPPTSQSIRLGLRVPQSPLWRSLRLSTFSNPFHFLIFLKPKKGSTHYRLMVSGVSLGYRDVRRHDRNAPNGVFDVSCNLPILFGWYQDRGEIGLVRTANRKI